LFTPYRQPRLPPNKHQVQGGPCQQHQVHLSLNQIAGKVQNTGVAATQVHQNSFAMLFTCLCGAVGASGCSPAARVRRMLCLLSHCVLPLPLCTHTRQVVRDGDGVLGLVDYATSDDMATAIKRLDDTEFKNPYDKYVPAPCIRACGPITVPDGLVNVLECHNWQPCQVSGSPPPKDCAQLWGLNCYVLLPGMWHQRSLAAALPLLHQLGCRCRSYIRVKEDTRPRGDDRGGDRRGKEDRYEARRSPSRSPRSGNVEARGRDDRGRSRSRSLSRGRAKDRSRS
jgi:hypothetical protein